MRIYQEVKRFAKVFKGWEMLEAKPGILSHSDLALFVVLSDVTGIRADLVILFSSPGGFESPQNLLRCDVHFSKGC